MSLTSALRTRLGRSPSSPLDTALGTVTVGGLTMSFNDVARPEPDLSARYKVPTSPAAPVDRIRSAWALTQATEGLDLDRSAHKLLVWADSWSAENVAGLVALIEAARAAGGSR
jgi:hypothetical protein